MRDEPKKIGLSFDSNFHKAVHADAILKIGVAKVTKGAITLESHAISRLSGHQKQALLRAMQQDFLKRNGMAENGG